jgi:hypothetical protein
LNRPTRSGNAAGRDHVLGDAPGSPDDDGPSVDAGAATSPEAVIAKVCPHPLQRALRPASEPSTE